MKKNILFTYDYELFLGAKSGTVNKCLLEPTQKLLCVHKRHCVTAIFFVDTLFLWRLKNQSSANSRTSKEFDLIVEQLRAAVKAGHYIYPHIHPHWLDAVYLSDSGEWDLSNIRYYKFSSLPESERNKTFDISMEMIAFICRPVNADYSIDAYRAGGWSIQPFSFFKEQFLKNGIKHEFSVIPGKKVASDAHAFDFLNAPDKASYNFEDDITKEEANGYFKAWTISSAVTSFKSRWLYFKIMGLRKRLGFNKNWGDGSVINVTVSENVDLVPKNKFRWLASFEGFTIVTAVIFFRKIFGKPYFQFISHPKMLSKADIVWFNIFLFCLKPFRFNSDFKKIQ